MKFSLECEVESRTKLFNDNEEVEHLEIRSAGRTYVFSTNENGYLNRVKIVSQADAPGRYYSRREQTTGMPTFTFRSDPEANRIVINELQLLEGLLALRASVRKINWGHPKFEYLPETEEERQQARLPSIASARPPFDTEASLSVTDLARIVGLKNRYAPLMIYLSFYREGVNEYKNYRYIYSFYNFYFILEGLYTRGNPKKGAVKNDFKQSAEMVANVETVIESYATNRPEYRQKVLAVLKRKKKELDIEGIIELLVSTRGELHHFQNYVNMTQPTTFNQDEFEVIAWITFALVELAIKKRIRALDEEALDQESIKNP